jgi:hypothetical protein
MLTTKSVRTYTTTCCGLPAPLTQSGVVPTSGQRIYLQICDVFYVDAASIFKALRDMGDSGLRDP